MGFKSSYFALCIAVFVSVNYIAAQSESSCTTPEPTKEQLASYASSLSLLDAEQSLTPNLLPTEDYDLPIQLIIFRMSDGSTPGTDGVEESIGAFARTLVMLNNDFHPNIKFHVCDVVVYDNNILFELQSLPRREWLEERHPDLPIDYNLINVFMTGAGGGQAGELGIKIRTGSTEGGFVMHEFGHYFGLFHTDNYAWSYTGCHPLYPDNSPNYDCLAAQDDSAGEWSPCETEDYFICYGDLIEDTPVPISPTDVTYSYCQLPQVGIIDNDEYSYFSQYDNAMTPFAGIRNYFTKGQQERMLLVLENSELGEGNIGGDITYLIDDEVPACSDVDVDDEAFIIAPVSKFYEVIHCDRSEEKFVLEPFEHLDVRFRACLKI